MGALQSSGALPCGLEFKMKFLGSREAIVCMKEDQCGPLILRTGRSQRYEALWVLFAINLSQHQGLFK